MKGTVTLASIYSDDSGTVKANPFTAGSDGTWFFYADNGATLVAPFFAGTLAALTPPGPLFQTACPIKNLNANCMMAPDWRSVAVFGNDRPLGDYQGMTSIPHSCSTGVHSNAYFPAFTIVDGIGVGMTKVHLAGAFLD
jgi:hypothetical protein